MQRKPSFPIANCNIKMPDSMPPHPDGIPEEGEQRRLQLINFGHNQWGFNNWSWSVTKQDLDFVDVAGGKFTAGVAAFVAVTVKSLDIRRDNVGYATAAAATKGAALHRARKCAVTNALKETLLSFGGAVTAELLELLELSRPPEPAAPPSHAAPPPLPHAPPVPAQLVATAPSPLSTPAPPPLAVAAPLPAAVVAPAVAPVPAPPPDLRVKKPSEAPRVAVSAPPVATAHPMPPAPRAPAPAALAPRAPRPPSNEAGGADAQEDARAERKRRQRQAQEEFRLKQLLKQKANVEKQKPEPDRSSSSFDALLSEIPTQDIVIEQSGAGDATPQPQPQPHASRPTSSPAPHAKRPSPASDAGAKRRANLSRLDIVTD